MQFFLDTANLDEISRGMALGVIDGVTTNPTLMSREGIRGEAAVKQRYVDICEALEGGPVSAEVIATDTEGMLNEGRELANLHPSIVVKVPCTREGIRTIRQFAQKKIPTNCTLVFSIGQALLAAKAGATYVSPFVGRLDDISEDGIQLVEEIVSVYEEYGFDTQVIAASIRHSRHIIDCLHAGADIATCPLKAIEALLQHPMTDRGVEQFLKDYESVQG